MYPLVFLCLFLCVRLATHFLDVPFAPWAGAFCVLLSLTLPWPREFKVYFDAVVLVMSQFYSAVYVIGGCDLHSDGLWNDQCVVKQCLNVLIAAVVNLVFVAWVGYERLGGRRGQVLEVGGLRGR